MGAPAPHQHSPGGATDPPGVLLSPHLSRKRNLMPAKATRSSTTRRSRFSRWLLWKAISGVSGDTHRGSDTPWPAVARGTPSTGEPTQPHIPCPAALPGAARDPEKGDMGAAPLASLVPIGDVLGSAPCPSYLVCPSVGPAAGSASLCPQGEAGARANRAGAAEQGPTGDPEPCRVTPAPGTCHSAAGWGCITGRARCIPAGREEVIGSHPGTCQHRGWHRHRRGTGGVRVAARAALAPAGAVREAALILLGATLRHFCPLFLLFLRFWGVR